MILAFFYTVMKRSKSKQDVLLGIHNFSEQKSLAHNAKILQLAKISTYTV